MAKKTIPDSRLTLPVTDDHTDLPLSGTGEDERSPNCGTSSLSITIGSGAGREGLLAERCFFRFVFIIKR